VSDREKIAKRVSTFPTLNRYLSLAGLIMWAATNVKKESEGIGEAIYRLKGPQPVVDVLFYLFEDIKGTRQAAPNAADGTSGPNKDPYLWQISLNRTALPALEKSVPAVKGDAARTLFKVNCSEIGWAVVDSGIDSTHPVFQVAGTNGDGSGARSRIVKAFDFSNIRRIVSLDNRKLDPAVVDPHVEELIAGTGITYESAVKTLKSLADDAAKDRAIDWSLVEQFVDITRRTQQTPASPHGTHVAGIIGADKHGSPDYADGMCPDINLYDFRVLNTGSSLADTEFAIIAALQYIRYLNDSRSFMTIHGVNLSISIPHDVRNFACGRTPICNECERLVESGVVVVAAAGNMGYHTFETRDGSYEGYTAFSITDPGNADSVITVGATHRSWPHTYGVSFFSSRGPTGDGRMKPDLVAPGERINSSVLNGDWKELDGTSMAAPHVSGAAAMLMARYAELVGQPRRIKSLLCDTATDLGRERSFQGCGMLDVLRAFQKV
jgi:subtilisin family serine protease